MHAVAVARFGPGPDIEDVVQDACLVAIASLDRLREPELAKSWLTGITRNLCREHARASSEVPLFLDSIGDALPSCITVGAGG
jgi:DNA-directed RNA polymerase specialized sigma24 family protein